MYIMGVGLVKFLLLNSNPVILKCNLWEWVWQNFYYLETFFWFIVITTLKSWGGHAAAAAKLLQLCLILCDPIDSSPPGSPVPGILQARTLEWVAISFSSAWKCICITLYNLQAFLKNAFDMITTIYAWLWAKNHAKFYTQHTSFNFQNALMS